MAETIGFALGALGLALLLALLTYNPADPSLDTATGGAARNLAGAPGAFAADLLLQFLGLAGTLPGLALLAWAWRIAAHRGIGNLWLRGGALVGAVLALAATLALLAGPAAGPGVFRLLGLGGAIGTLLAAPLRDAGQHLAGPAGPVIAATPCLIAGAMFLWVALGLSLADWAAAARLVARTALSIFHLSRSVGGASRRAGAAVSRRIRDPLAAQFDDQDGIELPPPYYPSRQAHAATDPADFLARGPAMPPPPAQAAPGILDQPLPPQSVKATLARARVTPRTRIQPPPPQQEELALPEPGWVFPSLALLKSAPVRASVGPSEDALQANARLLESVLADYGVQGAIRDIHPGPVVTLYELEPAPGIRAARVIGLADDVARSLSVTAVRIATVSGRNVIGIEVPNARRETVFLSELIGTEEFTRQGGRLALALGKDIGGHPQVADLSRMPHLLIAGTTGSGKSVGINAMILSLLYRLTPDQCKLILIDPKMLELSVYEGIPHLMAPVVTEPAKAVSALKWTVREMERRYRAMTGLGVRNVAGYNDRVAEARAHGEIVTRKVQTGFDPETNRPTFEEQPLTLDPMPLIVVVIDEMADLMMVAGKEIEAAVQRLAQMARAAGIHVIMATQRPSVDVITGTIKANFPTRISFQVISKFDSRTILGEQGAEQLLGMGDMLYMAGGGRITRLHGPFVTDREVEDVVAFLRSQGEPDYVDEVTEPQSDDGASSLVLGSPMLNAESEKTLFDQAVAVVAREGKASTSFIQRHLAIGYNKAAKLIEQMEREGIITQADHVGRREILVRRTREDE
jgi:S-DNA-T family DNA segregation ATPase FtsK/SpoIIIE